MKENAYHYIFNYIEVAETTIQCLFPLKNVLASLHIIPSSPHPDLH